jgi:hypothetical protein
VAALTMPSLVANYQNQVLKNQFKKMYSVLSQNLQKTAEVDFDGDTGCYAGGYVDNKNCPDFFRAFAANLNVIKTCKGNALSGGCIPQYTKYTKNAAYCGGYLKEQIENTDNAYVLNDGSIFIPYGRIDSPTGNGSYSLFMFDVNGKKGPNKIGHDVFSMVIVRQDGYYLTENLHYCLDDVIEADAPFKTLEDIMN